MLHNRIEKNDAPAFFYDVRGRIYSPSTRQFLTPDPFGRLAASPYAYVNNNPLNWIDPSGFTEEDAGGAWFSGFDSFFGAVPIAAIDMSSSLVTQAAAAVAAMEFPNGNDAPNSSGCPDGGFGPGDGLVGVEGGRDAHGRSLIELRDMLWLDERTPLPAGMVPLCDWGDAIWSCLDTRTEHVLTLDESGLTDTGQSFQSWLADWVSGIMLFDKMFIFEERAIMNPFTKQLMTMRTPSRAVGIRYR